MQEKYSRNLHPFKIAAALGGGTGFILLMLGFYVNGFTTSYLLTALGIGILSSAVVMYLAGTFLCLIAEYTANSKGKPKSVSSSRHLYLIK